jgi:hypothetical protein
MALSVDKSPNPAIAGVVKIDHDVDLGQKAFKSFVIARRVLAARVTGSAGGPTLRPGPGSGPGPEPILGGKSARLSLSGSAVDGAALKQAAAGLYPDQALTGAVKMARPKGFEPLTPRFVVWCSIQLSYGRMRGSLANKATDQAFGSFTGKRGGWQ